MIRLRTLASTVLTSVGVLWVGTATPVLAGSNWSVGIRIGTPGFYHRPWAPIYPIYRPYPVYVAPAPVYVQPAPVVLQPAPVYQPVYPAPAPAYQPAAPAPTYQAPTPTSVVSHASAAETASFDGERYLRQLADPNEQVRLDSALQLGRARYVRAVDPLAATLAGDRSPAVREAAARALGLISSPKALPALQGALADSDSQVRHSAQFAIDVIYSASGR